MQASARPRPPRLMLMLGLRPFGMDGVYRIRPCPSRRYGAGMAQSKIVARTASALPHHPLRGTGAIPAQPALASWAWHDWLLMRGWRGFSLRAVHIGSFALAHGDRSAELFGSYPVY